jgi:lipid A 4'-phosphatase
MRSSSVYLLLLAMSVAVALVPALCPSLDIAVSAYFLQSKPPLDTSKWLWVELINEHTPTVFRALVLLCLPAWLVARRVPRFHRWALPIVFTGLAVLVGPGLLVGAAKDYTLRARPFHVTEFGGVRQFSPALVKTSQCDDNCAFVSGHAADGFFLATLMLVDRRRRWWWLAAGVAGGLIIGFARISVGAHWLSDVLWAFPITLLGSWVVWYFLPKPSPTIPSL